MGGFFSSEPVTPLLQNTNNGNHVPQASNVSVASSIVRYKTSHHAFDIFEHPPSQLDTVYEHNKEREEVRDHPLEERMNDDDESSVVVPHEIQETSQTIYYNTPLEKIQEVSNKEFYDIRRIGVQAIIVTDDIVLKRHRSSRLKKGSVKPTSSGSQSP